MINGISLDKVKNCARGEYCVFLTPLAYNTYFLGIKIFTTIMCPCCGKKATRFTQRSALKAWNKKAYKD